MTRFEKKLAARGQKALEAPVEEPSSRASRVVRIYYISAGDELLYFEYLATWQQADKVRGQHGSFSGYYSNSIKSLAEAVQVFDKDLDVKDLGRRPLKGSRLVQLPSQYVEVLAVIPGAAGVDNNLALAV